MSADDRIEGGDASEISEIDHNRRMLRLGFLERNLLHAEEWTIRDREDRAGDQRRAPRGIGAEERSQHHQDRPEVAELERLRKPAEKTPLGAYDFAFGRRF